jgi:hypothetical protein
MIFLKVNHEDAGNNEYEIIAEGEYECIIADAEVAESKSGNPMLKLTITVRNDVKQPHRKQKLWDYLVVTEKAMFKFQQVAKAVALPNGKDFRTLEDFRLAILYKPVRIKVVHEENTYNGETKKQARIKAYSLATVEYATPASADPFATTTSPADDVASFL